MSVEFQDCENSEHKVFEFAVCKCEQKVFEFAVYILTNSCGICFSELNSKLQDTLVMIEEQIDVALSKTCSHFDEIHYEKVQTAYRLLGKTQVLYKIHLKDQCLKCYIDY